MDDRKNNSSAVVTAPLVAGQPSDLIEVPHPSHFIREEMDARDWGTPTMAKRMGGDYGINLLALEMYLSIGEREPGMRLGTMADDIARAFGTSEELFTNLEAAWLKYEARRAAISARKEQEGVASVSASAEGGSHSPNSPAGEGSLR